MLGDDPHCSGDAKASRRAQQPCFKGFRANKGQRGAACQRVSVAPRASLQVARAPLGEDPDAALVAGSFERVLAQGDALPRRVFERLFALGPDLRALFPADLEPQQGSVPFDASA